MTKRDLLSKLTRENLVDLAETYGVDIERTWPKDALVEALAVSRRIKTEGLLELSKKIQELGNVPSAVFGAKQGFFDETAATLFDQIDALSDSLSAAIAAAEIIDPGYIDRIKVQLSGIRAGKIFQVDPVPDHIWQMLSGRQKGAYGTAKSLGYQIPKFVQSALGLSTETDFVCQQNGWRDRHLPPRVEYYVLQAHRSYVARCYDASIVMTARALEHLLKKKLGDAKVPIPEKATLGKLVELHRRSIGNNQCLEKVLEVSTMDRVISAHDIPPYDREMERKDADHAWTALDIALRDLP